MASVCVCGSSQGTPVWPRAAGIETICLLSIPVVLGVRRNRNSEYSVPE
jgi:hypothetical protein